MSAQVEAPRSTPVLDVLETEEAKGLLETGRQQGSLTSEAITSTLDELDLDAGQIDDFYHALEEAQIEVVDEKAADEEALDLKPEVR